MSVGPMGMSSGMDINSMVSKVVDSERVPKQQRIDNERTEIATDISAYGRLRESLDSMKSLMAAFRQEKAFAVRTVVSSNDAAVSATATTEAIAGRYAIDVLQLAQSHKVASNPVSEDVEFGPGKLQVSLGERSFSVDIRARSKLIDVVRGINSASGSSGVRAAIINDSEGQRLVVASDKSGIKNKIKVSVQADASNPLQQLSYLTVEDRTAAVEQAQQELQTIIAENAQQSEAAAALAAQIESESELLLSEEDQSDVVDGEEPESTRPEDTIPGWTETASGTLIDSYDAPVTESEELQNAVENGEITAEEARQIQLNKLTEEEKARQLELEQAQEKLNFAQQSLVNYQGMTEVQQAQDAEIMLDGIARLSSENNVIENAIDGIDITVKSVTDPNAPKAEINVEYDKQRVKEDILQFVNAYNQFYQVSKELSAVDPTTGMAGPLAGDSVIRSAESRLKTVFSTSIEKAPEDLKSLTEFGITGTRQGTLEINDKILNRQLNKNFVQLEDFFGGKDGFAKKVEDTIHSLTNVTGAIRSREKSLTEQNYRLNDEQAQLDRRMETIETRTREKFRAMQDATANMQGQLSGMMNALGSS